MKIIQEFKEFAMKGNMIDLAVGVVIGASFGKTVASLVNDIIMPLFSFVTGGINFRDLKITLIKTIDGSPTITWNYGNFIQITIEFFVIAVSIFILIKIINQLRRKQEQQSAPSISKQEQLLGEIRDLLKE